MTLTEDINRLEKSIYQQAGEEFNIASPKQLGIVLFENMQLVKPNQKRQKLGNMQNRRRHLIVS